VAKKETGVPNPKRVTAGRINRQKRKLTEAGRQRLREAAMNNKPWDYATGPRTDAGKAKSAQNGWRQEADISFRRLREKLRDVQRSADELAELRRKMLGD
jgi:hypothetical protein